jgi:hypothetical protein
MCGVILKNFILLMKNRSFRARIRKLAGNENTEPAPLVSPAAPYVFPDRGALFWPAHLVFHAVRGFFRASASGFPRRARLSAPRRIFFRAAAL